MILEDNVLMLVELAEHKELPKRVKGLFKHGIQNKKHKDISSLIEYVENNSSFMFTFTHEEVDKNIYCHEIYNKLSKYTRDKISIHLQYSF